MATSTTPPAVTAEPVRDIGEEVAKIADAMARINSGKLARRAIILLVSDASGVGKRDVEYVLNGLSNLRRFYLKP